MKGSHFHLRAPVGDVRVAAESVVGQEASSMMRTAAPTCPSSVTRKARFVHVGDLPQGEPKAP